MPSYLSAIGTATPPHRLAQPVIADFMARALNLDESDTRKLQTLYRASGITQRHSVLADYGQADGEFTFFPNTPGLEPFPGISQRMAAYRRTALPLALEAARAALAQLPDVAPASLTHIITVSCTGMYAPGLDVELVTALGLSTSIRRTCVNFMGCYAIVGALRLADSMVRADPASKVLVVGVELCTLHFQKSHEPDHLVSNSLFGDGAAAALVTGQPSPAGAAPYFEMQAFHSGLEAAGEQDMAWRIGDFGFEMTLSGYVPALIEGGINHLLAGLLQDLPVRREDIRHFALHPGGRKILTSIEKALDLTPEDNCYAYQVLRDYGNMSSVTVLFVLRELLAATTPADNDAPVLSCAFGPGLSMEAMLLKICA